MCVTVPAVTWWNRHDDDDDDDDDDGWPGLAWAGLHKCECIGLSWMWLGVVLVVGAVMQLEGFSRVSPMW
jgi:hypothetical protein